MNTIALDYETYYDKECSIKSLGNIGYFSHPLFDAYMISAWGDDGTEFVGCPKSEFDWSIIEGNRILSHNASFDETLYLFGVDKGWWPLYQYKEWLCTADLAAYCGLPRSLKGSTTEVFDLDISKETRDSMMGKRWEDMTEDFKKEVSDYALKDSELCLRLWDSLKDKWPQQERDISVLNRRISQRGIPINTTTLKDQNNTIAQKLFEAENAIPGIGDAPTLSRKAFNNECRKMGLEPPLSLAMTDKDANKWITENGQKYKWIGAVRDFRRINSLKKKLESFRNATMSDSRYYGNIMYWGASTGRFSGGGGNLNLQNLPRGEIFGVDLRKLISTKPDKRLVVADLSQIEVRTLCWLAGDKEILDEIRNSDDIYETFAIRFKMWDEHHGSMKLVDPKRRHLVKTMVLGCGYGASHKKFSEISGLSITKSFRAVRTYREYMKREVRLWSIYQRGLHTCYGLCEPFKIDLPSGRSLDYGMIKSHIINGRRHLISMIARGAKKTPIRLWGGLLTENASQALARDVFSDILLRLEENNMNVIFHVHDEVVIEADKEDAENVLEDVIKIMSTPPVWLPDIPLAAEGKVLTQYEK